MIPALEEFTNLWKRQICKCLSAPKYSTLCDESLCQELWKHGEYGELSGSAHGNITKKVNFELAPERDIKIVQVKKMMK